MEYTVYTLLVTLQCVRCVRLARKIKGEKDKMSNYHSILVFLSIPGRFIGRIPNVVAAACIVLSV